MFKKQEICLNEVTFSLKDHFTTNNQRLVFEYLLHKLDYTKLQDKLGKYAILDPMYFISESLKLSDRYIRKVLNIACENDLIKKQVIRLGKKGVRLKIHATDKLLKLIESLKLTHKINLKISELEKKAKTISSSKEAEHSSCSKNNQSAETINTELSAETINVTPQGEIKLTKLRAHEQPPISAQTDKPKKQPSTCSKFAASLLSAKDKVMKFGKNWYLRGVERDRGLEITEKQSNCISNMLKSCKNAENITESEVKPWIEYQMVSDKEFSGKDFHDCIRIIRSLIERSDLTQYKKPAGFDKFLSETKNTKESVKITDVNIDFSDFSYE